MSFSENPFRYVEFRITPEGRVHLECSSCGGGWRTTWAPAETTVQTLIDAQRAHVRSSHKRTEADFDRGGSW